MRAFLYGSLGAVVFAVGLCAAAEAVSHAKDPAKETVLIGVTAVASGTPNEMVIKLELEPAKAMTMFHQGAWMDMAVKAGEPYHFEVKPEDPKSKTRIAFARVLVSVLNRDNGRKIDGELHPMWGGSGLHYAMNGPLHGDGTYRATVTIEPPTFARDVKERERWTKAVTATFNFRVRNGMVLPE